MLSSLWKMLSDGDAYNQMGDWLVSNVPGYSRVADMFGYSQKRNSERSTTTQIGYENYLSGGNRRALEDWHRNLPGRTIRYPEFSYEGQLARSGTAIARAGFDYANAGANYYGNLPYRTAGLYGVASRFSRYL